MDFSERRGNFQPRRRFLQSTAALGLLQAFRGLAPAYAQSVPGPGGEIRVGGSNVADLVIARTPFGYAGWSGSAVTIVRSAPTRARDRNPSDRQHGFAFI